MHSKTTGYDNSVLLTYLVTDGGHSHNPYSDVAIPVASSNDPLIDFDDDDQERQFFNTLFCYSWF